MSPILSVSDLKHNKDQIGHLLLSVSICNSRGEEKNMERLKDNKAS